MIEPTAEHAAAAKIVLNEILVALVALVARGNTAAIRVGYETSLPIARAIAEAEERGRQEERAACVEVAERSDAYLAVHGMELVSDALRARSSAPQGKP